MKEQENSENQKNVTLSHDVVLALEDLFQFSSPRQLRISLMEIFFSHLCNTKLEEYKPEIKNIAADFYFLLKFLEEAEMYEKEKDI
ncbi:MAG TPA: hypothetical protein VNW99_07940 [Cytophagaceae bacterium]|jgi:hypothetical protein|nr:hypothetical protein [Cytophagaceae bacterium]